MKMARFSPRLEAFRRKKRRACLTHWLLSVPVIALLTSAALGPLAVDDAVLQKTTEIVQFLRGVP